jgi:hypothetical protein
LASVAEARHFYPTPALGKNFEVLAPALALTSAPWLRPLLLSKPKFLTGTEVNLGVEAISTSVSVYFYIVKM